MKDAWSEENDQAEFLNGTITSIPKPHRPSLLNGLASPPDRETVLSSLPAKDVADKLINRFFDHYNPCIPAKCK
jgi:hypothetical protein